eukprot:9473175-Pyramimonas_sp.AAC.1
MCGTQGAGGVAIVVPWHFQATQDQHDPGARLQFVPHTLVKGRILRPAIYNPVTTEAIRIVHVHSYILQLAGRTA